MQHPDPNLIANDPYLRWGIALAVHELYSHTYPPKHRAAARMTLLSTWWSNTARDGVLERGALTTALPYLTTARQVRASLLSTPPADTGRAAGLRHLLTHMTKGGPRLVSGPRERSDERATAALAMADGLLEVLPELVDLDVLEVWAQAVAAWEREHGAWVIDLLEAGNDPYDDLLTEAAPDPAAEEEWWAGPAWRLG